MPTVDLNPPEDRLEGSASQFEPERDSPPRPSRNILERNLAALSRSCARVAERLDRVPARRDISFSTADDGAVTAMVGEGPAARALASRRRPLQEAQRLADTIPIEDAGGVVVMGFGLGHHIRALARRMKKTGVIFCFEPDLGLLRAVLERVDHSEWIEQTNFAILTEPDDPAAVSAYVKGVEGALALGIKILHHPPSRPRLGPAAERFEQTVLEVVRALRMTVMTTLVKMEETLSNLLMNLDHYTASPGVGDLAGSCAGRAAIVVSAGPSLRRNIDLLSRPGVRDRFVIIAAQTVLRPLLERGIRPHYVTALDFAEISKRFYEGLTAEDVRGVTLVADPKANPAILDAFPGLIRTPGNDFLDGLLGEQFARGKGSLTPGATVAHLAYYLARHLGCDPVILMGQDLGFTNGQYYAAGAAIHNVWAPELGPFRTLEMFEWERIARGRNTLLPATDVLGRPIYTDEQMHNYLVQFERDFAADAQRGLRTVDATEGGVAKKHTAAMTLAEALERFMGEPVPASRGRCSPARPSSTATVGGTAHADRARLDGDVRRRLIGRVKRIRQEVADVGACSREARDILEKMLAAFDDRDRVNSLIQRVHTVRDRAMSNEPAFGLVHFLNQIGALNRVRADRRIELAAHMDPVERQRRQVERDIANVQWLADAASRLGRMLDQAAASLGGAEKITRPTAERDPQTPNPLSTEARGRDRIMAVVRVDERAGGLGTPRNLDRPLALGMNPLRLMLSRLARCGRLDGVVLIADDPARARQIAGEVPEGLRLEIVPSAAEPTGPELASPASEAGPPAVAAGDGPGRLEPGPTGWFAARTRAVGAARAWAPECWRGGIGGLTCYDEALDAPETTRIAEQLNLSAAVILGADWALADPDLINTLIQRHQEDAENHKLVFSQAPPGLGACVLGRSLIADLAAGAGTLGLGATIGWLLGYNPARPQPDPIAKPLCVPIPPHIRDLGLRCIPDSPDRRAILAQTLESLGESIADAGLEHIAAAHGPEPQSGGPGHITLELTPRRLTAGRRAQWLWGDTPPDRPDLTPDRAAAIFESLTRGRTPPALTLAGAGDPLLNPRWPQIIRLAREAGIGAIHIRTDLLCDEQTLEKILESGADVVSIDLMAVRPETYRELLGVDGLASAQANTMRLIERRATHSRAAQAPPNPSDAGLPTPWIVPRITRCDDVYDQIEPFYDTWIQRTGAAVIDPLPRPIPGQRIEPLPLPGAARRRLAGLLILSDGSVPAHESDAAGRHPAGRIGDGPLEELWERILAARAAPRREGFIEPRPTAPAPA